MGSTIIALLTIRSLQDGFCLMTAQSRYLFYLVHQSLSLKSLLVRGKSSENLGHYKLLQKVGKSFSICDLGNLQSFSQIYNPVILCSISWIFMHPHFLQFFRDIFFTLDASWLFNTGGRRLGGCGNDLPEGPFTTTSSFLWGCISMLTLMTKMDPNINMIWVYRRFLHHQLYHMGLVSITLASPLQAYVFV